MFMFAIVPCQVPYLKLAGTHKCCFEGGACARPSAAANSAMSAQAIGKLQAGRRRASMATRRSSSAQTSAMRPEITMRPAPAEH